MPEDIGPTLERIKKNFDTLLDRLKKRCAEVSAKDFSEHDFSKVELKALKHNRDFQAEKQREIKRLKGQELKVTRIEMLSVAAAELSLAQGVLGNAQGQFWHFTQPDKLSEADKTELREFRNVIRSYPKDEKQETKERGHHIVSKRADFINKIFETGDNKRALTFLHAAITSPEELIDADSLLKLRAAYTIAHKPKLHENLQYGQFWYAEVRRLLAKYNSEAVRTLMTFEADDPITVAEHAEAFPPLTDRDREMTGKRILEEQRRKDREEREEV